MLSAEVQGTVFICNARNLAKRLVFLVHIVLAISV